MEAQKDKDVGRDMTIEYLDKSLAQVLLLLLLFGYYKES